MSASDFLKKLPLAFDASQAAGTNCVLQFNVAQPVYVTIKDGTCTVSDGTDANADVAMTMEDADMIDLLKGALNPMQAFMSGKLQVEGDLMLAQRISNFFDQSKASSL